MKSVVNVINSDNFKFNKCSFYDYTKMQIYW